MKKCIRYLRGHVTGTDVSDTIQSMLDQHVGMKNPFAFVNWTDRGCLIELHFVS